MIFDLRCNYLPPVTQMIKALSTIVLSALIATALLVLPFTTYLQAGEPVALEKSDRLVIDRGCAKQTWPNFTSACLRGNGAQREARLVTADRG